MGKDYGIENIIIPEVEELELTGNLTKFRKYKELKLGIKELKFHKTYGYYLWLDNVDNTIFDYENENYEDLTKEE
jgi:hypothetical protein